MAKPLNGFKVLPVSFSSTSSTYHQLFIKEDSSSNNEKDKPAGKTLFVINVPPYATEDSIKCIFSSAGAVQKVSLQNKPGSAGGFKIAYVIFKKESGLTEALMLKSLEPLNTNEHRVPVGIEKWVSDYNNSIYDHQELQTKVDTFMAKFDKESIQISKQKGVDEDGWTVITKKGRNPGLSRKESVENHIMEKIKKKAKHKELKNFYTFQIKESKKKHIEELRKKFESDKHKINLLKQSRKFKPF